MERKLLRVIMNPAMMLTWIAGIAMVVLRPSLLTVLSWFHVKLLLVLVITVMKVERLWGGEQL